MTLIGQYLKRVIKILQEIAEKETVVIDKAATLIADKVIQDKLIHVFGSGGHSIMGAMEVFWRAGGFANVNPLFPAGLSLIDSHPNIERTAGLSRRLARPAHTPCVLPQIWFSSGPQKCF